MTRSVQEAFRTFLSWKTPSASQRQAAAVHRASVERSVTNTLATYRILETGSFSHGTGVAGFSDVDLLVSLKGLKPDSSDTALRWIRQALVDSFPHTRVRTSRPAVVVPFASGFETFEIIPGFTEGARSTYSPVRYSIPAPAGGWMSSTPTAHLAYVSVAESSHPGTKSLARLLKAWKYEQDVPISSFYLEMRAAEYMNTQTAFEPLFDLCAVLEDLDRIELAAMRDPTGNTGLIRATSSLGTAFEAKSKTHSAAVRARNALNASDAGNEASCFRYLNLLFNGTFPAQ